MQHKSRNMVGLCVTNNFEMHVKEYMLVNLNGTKFECDYLIGSPCQELFYIRSELRPEVIPAIT